jgi:hypothetical protein
VTPEEENFLDRTAPLGMFNMAESYWHAARYLQAGGLKTTHSNSPVSFLYYHAIELYLKAFLRLSGHTPRELSSKKYGHKIDRLAERAGEIGLPLMDEDKEVVSMAIDSDAPMRARYLQVGYFRWPGHDAIDRTCQSLRQSVGGALRKSGLPVRI